MTSTVVFTTIAGVLALVGALYAWRFVLVYGKHDWRRYAAGRHLMSFTKGLAIILTYSVIGLVARIVLGEPQWLLLTIDMGRILIFGWVAVQLFIRYQLLEESEDETEGTDDESTQQSV